MITYTRTKIETTGNWKYSKFGTITKNHNIFLRENQVPPIVLKTFDDTGVMSYEYDNKLELPRCIFCEGYKSHTRMFMGEMVALCNEHYYDKRIGQIAAQLRLMKKGQEHGILIEKSKAGRKKKQSSFIEAKE